MQERKTILVVEDEEPIRRLVVCALTKAGYSVLEAADPLVACELFRYQPVDLLFTYIDLPHNHGTDLARALVLRRPQTRIVFTSGLCQTAFAQTTACRFVAGAFLQKPYTLDQLQAAVARALAD